MKLAAFMDFETFNYIKNADNKFWNNKKKEPLSPFFHDINNVSIILF